MKNQEALKCSLALLIKKKLQKFIKSRIRDFKKKSYLGEMTMSDLILFCPPNTACKYSVNQSQFLEVVPKNTPRLDFFHLNVVMLKQSLAYKPRRATQQTLSPADLAYHLSRWNESPRIALDSAQLHPNSTGTRVSDKFCFST